MGNAFASMVSFFGDEGVGGTQQNKQTKKPQPKTKPVKALQVLAFKSVSVQKLFCGQAVN